MNAWLSFYLGAAAGFAVGAVLIGILATNAAEERQRERTDRTAWLRLMRDAEARTGHPVDQYRRN